MTNEEAKRRLLDIERCTPIHTRDDARDFEALEMAIQALSQEPCEKQIKIGTKVRTTKDKDFACEKVFPVGTIGIVERIDKGDNLPYKIVANDDYFYYSRDMFEIIEDVEPCDDAISREYLKKMAQSEGAYGYVSAYDIATAPSVTPSNPKGHWVHKGQGIYCSECNGESGYNPFGASRFSDYCPNCGADMRGAE